MSSHAEPPLALVTGMPHSGTTLVSRIIACHPRVECGFECGLLLADSPAAFPGVQPFFDWMQQPVEAGHWGMSRADMELVCAAPTFVEAYRRIVGCCPRFRDGAHLLVDKTPAYLSQLPRVLARVQSAPCLVVEKRAILQWRSLEKRGEKASTFLRRCAHAASALRRASRRFGERIVRVRHERLARDPEACAKAACDVLELDFRPEHFDLDGQFTPQLAALGRFGGMVPRQSYSLEQEIAEAYETTGAAERLVVNVLGGVLRRARRGVREL